MTDCRPVSAGSKSPVRRRPVLTAEVAASLAAQRSLMAGYRRVGVTGQTFSIYLCSLLMLIFEIGRRSVSVGSDKRNQSPVILLLVWMVLVAAILLTPLFPPICSVLAFATGKNG